MTKREELLNLFEALETVDEFQWKDEREAFYADLLAAAKKHLAVKRRREENAVQKTRGGNPE
jgi:hypothetical protein